MSLLTFHSTALKRLYSFLSRGASKNDIAAHDAMWMSLAQQATSPWTLPDAEDCDVKLIERQLPL